MSRIHRLPEELANQIAAGEVVERPASVVKELIENALDAGAARIAVTIELGGKRSIRVEDDGDGMTAEEARLALERHATSKIRTADDLAAIATLGFRGEALPSIASVSRLTLRTRARGSLNGTELRVHAGALVGSGEVGMPEGTRLDVDDLFYNLPARRKFLKSDAAESAQVSRLVTQQALGAPSVGFSLVSAGRRILSCPPASDRRERLFQIARDSDALVEVHKQVGDLLVTGFVAPLAETGPRRGPQHVFINGRFVRDRTIAHAIGDAYSVASIKERSPEVHLFIEMPLDAVDVNVHPTKAEVRFREQSLVHQVIRRAVADALGQGPAPALALSALQPGYGGGTPRLASIPGILSGAFPTGTALGTPESAGLLQRSEEAAAPGAPPAGTPDAAEGASDTFHPLLPLGQFRDTFIIAVDADGIAIIDQHVAHERVLYERTVERLSRGRLESQRLLTPLVLDLPPGGSEALLTRSSELDRLGFEVEPFSGGSLKVSALPALLGVEAAAATLRALAGDVEGFDRGSPAEEALKQMAATIACHAAVKANDRLTHEKMVHILEELRATAYSTICPHGRPVMLRITRREVERNFQRI